MAGLRFRMDLFVPEVENGTVVAGVKIPTALANEIPSIKHEIQVLKSYAEKINEGQDNEEMTIYASYHVCHHNEVPPAPCEPEIDI